MIESTRAKKAQQSRHNLTRTDKQKTGFNRFDQALQSQRQSKEVPGTRSLICKLIRQARNAPSISTMGLATLIFSNAIAKSVQKTELQNKKRTVEPSSKMRMRERMKGVRSWKNKNCSRNSPKDSQKGHGSDYRAAPRPRPESMQDVQSTLNKCYTYKC